METLQSYNYDVNPIVCNYFKTSCKQLEVLLSSALSALNSKRSSSVYKFYAPELEIQAIAKGHTIINFITKLNINVNNILDILKNVDDEFEFYQTIGENIYIFIKYTILTTKQYFITTNKLIIPIELCNIMQFKMIHSSANEMNFKTKKTRILFHGSGFENWYNILRTGLKIPIGEQHNLLVNGNAYGSGIYLSDSPTFSLSYCNSRIDPNTHHILAICEVIENAAISKSSNIFLVTEENNILIRYILYFDNKTMVNSLFNKELSHLIENLYKKKTENLKKNKRLLIELSKIQAENELHILVTPVFNNVDIIASLIIEFTDFGNYDTKLIHQIHDYKIKTVKIELIFGSNFPFSPPLMRLVYPRLLYQPLNFKLYKEIEFIDNGGGICTSLFKTGEWIPSYPLLNLIIYLQNLILSTNGFELDPETWNIPYTIQEALINFNTIIGTFDIGEAIDLLDSK